MYPSGYMQAMSCKQSALDSSWQRAIAMAIRGGVIAEEDRFSLHGLKHRSVTDTEGNFDDLQDRSGHVDPQWCAATRTTCPWFNR